MRNWNQLAIIVIMYTKQKSQTYNTSLHDIHTSLRIQFDVSVYNMDVVIELFVSVRNKYVFLYL